jgi:hypothetical protein
MKIQNINKKIIIVSLIFILTGAFISIIGYGAAGFNYQKLKDGTKENVWYQTIHTNEDSFWYGIDLGNGINLFVIGNSD